LEGHPSFDHGKSSTDKIFRSKHVNLFFHIYKWPASLLHQLDVWTRNFIWSGDIHTQKACTVAWNSIRTPFDVGGLVASYQNSSIVI
jgi:hypothetical protein